MIAIIDYGVGNLFSLCSSLRSLGVETVVTGDSEKIKKADKLILPGVGAFEDAAKKLRESGLFEVVKSEAKNGKPLLGICLGMQMLFDKSFEYGCHEGLGLIKGEVKPLQGRIPESLNIPHIGWNALNVRQASPILKYVNNGDHVYFVHSYFVDGDNHCTVATAEYGVSVTGTVQNGNIYGCQFHPEKSGKVGLAILKAFSELD